MMRPTITEMAGGMKDRRQKQRLPDVVETRRRLLRADLQREGHALAVVFGQQQIRIERVSDVMDVLDSYSRLAQTKIDSVEGQLPGRERYWAFAVLNVREALFLGGGDDAAIGNETSGRIVKGRIDS
jgi:hypothetical protein